MTEQQQAPSRVTVLTGGRSKQRARPALSSAPTRPTSVPPVGQRTGHHTALVLTRLSAVVSQLHGIRAILPDEEGIHGRLTSVEQELEAIGQQVLVGPGVAATSTASTDDGAAHDPDQLGDIERAVISWLTRCYGADTSSLMSDNRDEPSRKQLRGLTTSRHRPPPAVRERLGLSEQATIGDVAMELLLAVDGPGGPHCRSYRSAVFYLIGRAELAATP